MREHITPQQLLTTGRLQKQAGAKHIIFVEGTDDSIILTYTLELEPGVVVLCFGKQNVLDASRLSKAGEFIFLVDKDFDSFTDQIPDNVLYTEYYDIENHAIRSKKFGIVVEKFCSRDKCPSAAHAMKVVDPIAAIFAKARLACLKLGLGFEIDENLIHRCLEGASDIADQGVLEQELFKRIPFSKEQRESYVAEYGGIEFGERSTHNLPSDIWLSIFGKLLRRQFGNCQAQQSKLDHLHAILVSSVDKESFQSASWWAAIRDTVYTKSA